MRRIEIITPQHVSITYYIASVRDRAMAFLLDAIILFGFLSISSTVIYSLNLDSTTISSLLILINFPVFIFYSLIFEVLTGGQTPGKMALKIHVIKINGAETSLTDYLLRWAFRWVDIWGSLGSIAALQVSSSEKGQRIGDVLADTTVVKVRGDYHVTLKELLNIKKIDDYEVSFPQAKQMKEKEMLLVKLALDQHKKFPNEEHSAILKTCANKIKARLGIEETKSDPRQFLNVLLRDYITLTRS